MERDRISGRLSIFNTFSSASALLPFQQLLHFRRSSSPAPAPFQHVPLFIYFFATFPFCLSFFFFFSSSPFSLPPEPSRQKVVPAETRGGASGGKKKLLSESGSHLSFSLPPPLFPCAARRGGMNAEPVSSELPVGKREEKRRALGMETHFCPEGWLLSACVWLCAVVELSACPVLPPARLGWMWPQLLPGILLLMLLLTWWSPGRWGGHGWRELKE